MWRDQGHLLDMLLASRDMPAFARECTWTEFQVETPRPASIFYKIVVIGEAANRVSQQTQAAHPEIPWREITGMRNVLVHDYGKIDIAVVWDTVEHGIPQLIAALEPLISPE